MRALNEFGEVTGPGSASGTNTLGKDWPFVFGNVFAICGGGVIAIIGSLIDEPTILENSTEVPTRKVRIGQFWFALKIAVELKNTWTLRPKDRSLFCFSA